MSVKFTSFQDEMKKGVQKLMFNVVDAVSLNSERVIKQEFTLFTKAPVDTGTLRRSVTGKVVETRQDVVTAEVRTSTERALQGQQALSRKAKGGKKKVIQDIAYAKFVEYGTVNMPARPFMRNGMARAKKSNEAIIRKVISGANTSPIK